MPEGITTAIGTATEIMFNMDDMVVVTPATEITFNEEDRVEITPATTVTFTLNEEDIVIGGTTFISSSDINYNNLVNRAIAFPANGMPVVVDNTIVDSRLVENRNGTITLTASTSYNDIGTVPFSSDEARIAFRAVSQIITDDLTPTILNRLKVKNYKAVRLSDEKKVVWDGAEVLWIYDTKSNDIDAILIKDIRFKLCCPKNDFNYNYYDHSDNGSEGFGILIGDSHHSLIEVC